MTTFFEQLARLSPERRALLERKLAEQGLGNTLPDRIPSRPAGEPAPLSFAQQRLWFVQQLDPASTAYNVASVLRLSGELNVNAMFLAITQLVQRHESLRSRFVADGIASQPRQFVEPVPDNLLPLTDLRIHTDPENVAKTYINKLIAAPFDLTRIPLRTALLQLEDREHLLILATHHIVSDRWSVGVFLRELAVLYQAARHNRPSPLQPLSIQYADYAHWQRQALQGEELQRVLDYWTQKLAGHLPLLDLPHDRPRPRQITDRGAQWPIYFSAALSEQLRALAQSRQVTLFTLLLAAFKVLLYRYSGQHDILVGTDIANRERPETEHLIGLLVNTLVLRSDLQGNPAFTDLLTQVRQTLMDALAHQALPFEKLVETLNPDRHLDQLMPLFQAKLDLQLARVQPVQLDGLTLNRETPDDTRTKYELRFNLQDSGDSINGQIEYSCDLFDEVTVAAMGCHFETLLQSIVAVPDTSIDTLPLVNSEERLQLLFDFNRTQRSYPPVPSLVYLFEAQVLRTPDFVAVSDEEKVLTYRELNAAANRISLQLIQAGVTTESPVGICMPRSVRMIAGLLGILKAGGCYVPLDPDYPAERLQLIADDARMNWLLVDAQTDQSIPVEGERLHCIAVSDFIATDTDDSCNPAIPLRNDQLAYVIYTSGSTGRPKGVAIEHRNAVAMVQWAQEEFSNADIECVLAATSICFDLSVYEIFLPLSIGGRIRVANNALSLTEMSAADGITLINTVPSVLTRVLNSSTLPDTIRVVNLAGEALPPALLARLQSLGHVQRAYNLYGPSEDTTYSTWARFDLDQPLSALTRAPIGQPLSNTQAYVLDPQLQPVPMGVSGELYLGGDGLARGYLNQPDLTARSFIDNLFLKDGAPSARLYRTGDQVRRRRDGSLEFLGRRDDQVKIRGYRIETGEIDHALRMYPLVREALVTAQDITQSGEKQLVAYVEAGPALDTTDLRKFLQQRLPAHLVPAHLFILEQFPRLPNGKINRQSLPVVDSENTPRQRIFVAPRTSLENTLADIWGAVLNRAAISIDDNFFELGGHSLLAMDMVARIQQQLNLHLPLRRLFQSPTIEGLAEVLRKNNGEKIPAPVALPQLKADPQAAFEPFPLTDIQQAYLLGRNAAFELGNISTHAYREIEVTGLSPTAVENALNALIKRHPMLRMVVSGGQQKILADVPAFALSCHDLRCQTCDIQEQTLGDIRQRLSHQIFDTAHWPLFGIEASQLDNNRVRFHLSFDVLIGDAWSFQLLGREMAMLLLGKSLPPLDITFRDYVMALHSYEATPAYHAARDYWRNRIADLPPAPELPLTMAPGQISTPRFVRRSGQLAAPQWKQLQNRARQHGLTPASTVLAVFSETLADFCRHPSFTLNLTLFNRLPIHADVNRLVGDFTASLLLSIYQRGNLSFIDNAKTLQQQLWQDLEHRAVSGVQVQRELARSQQRAGAALMPVVFTSTLDQHMQTGSPSQWQVDFVHGVSQTSQVYLDHQVSEVEGALHFNWDAIDNLFPSGLLEQLNTIYKARLQQLAADDDTWQKAWQQPLPADRHAHWLPSFNATHQTLLEPGQPSPMLHDLFFAAANQFPDNIAVISGDRQLHYLELATEVQCLAATLQARHVQPNELVAIALEKGWRQVVATLAVLSAGAAYVPIDPALPRVRRDELLADTQSRLLLLADDAEFQDWPANIETICIAAKQNVPSVAPALAPITTRTTDLAYVIYTSGSTGMPKGVMIDHRGAVNTVLDINRRHQVGPSDRIFGLSALNFDLSVYDLFGTLACGAALVLPDAEQLQQPLHWLEHAANTNVTIWNSVPTLMQLLTEISGDIHAAHRNALARSLRKVFLSGDWIPLTLPDAIHRVFPNANVISMGGATEASIWSIDYPVQNVEAEWHSIPYGRPLANQQWYVLDEHMRPRPPWVPGPLYIGGIGLARGYWRRPELTARQFVPNPLLAEWGGFTSENNRNRLPLSTLYRTGDLGCYRPDGTLEFLGREDHQVKLNGYRVELGEIEAVLQQHPGIAAAAVAINGNPASLNAYVVPRQSQDAKNATTQSLSGLARLDFKNTHVGWRDITDSNSIQLPESPAPQSLLQRQSHRRFLSQRISLQRLAGWLSSLRAWPMANAPMPKYRYPSAGNSYPLQAWLQVKQNAVEGLAAGWYYYHPGQHRLQSIQISKQHPDYGINQSIFEQAGFALFLVAQRNAIEPLYGKRARDLALLETGYASQLLMETAPEFNLGLCPLGSELDSVQSILELPTGSEVIHGLLGGPIDPAWNNQWQAMQSQPSNTIDTLQQWLRERLPAYMVPTRIQPIQALPLTPNGKLDRKALPEPDSRPSNHIPPQTNTEQRICVLWQELLNAPQIGLTDDFFALGGNSLIAMQLMNRLQESFALELSLGQLYGALTPGAQATLMDRLMSESSADTTTSPRSRDAIPRAQTTAAFTPPTPDINSLSASEVDDLLAQLLAAGEEMP